jgi:hypothetical protein
MTLLEFHASQFRNFRKKNFERKNLGVLAGAMTPLKFEYCRFFRRILGHMQNGFSP